MELIRLRDHLDRQIVFTGEVIGRAPVPGHRLRWTELTLYRHAEGGYVYHRAGCSRAKGEKTLNSLWRLPDAASVLLLLENRDGNDNPYLSRPARAVLEQAARNDADMARVTTEAEVAI